MADPQDTSPSKLKSKIGRKSSSALPARFYDTATVHPIGHGFGIHLDARPVRTPSGSELVVPSEALGLAIAEEWQLQHEVIDPALMPLTKLTNSTLDGVVAHAQDVLIDMANYAGHDVVCYRAEHPADLVARQATIWHPILAWAEKRLQCSLVCTSGVMPVVQSPDVIVAVRKMLAGLDPFQLAAVHEMTVLTGSVLLPLACIEGVLTIEAVSEAAHIDEDWQIAQWGADQDAQDRRRARWRDLQSAHRLFVLCQHD